MTPPPRRWDGSRQRSRSGRPAAVLRRWIERYGVPQALYTDWKNVYVRPPNAQERMRVEPAVTQFGRMCAKLGIEIIAANSPQARARGAGARHTSGSVGEETAAGRNRQLPTSQCLSRRALPPRPQPALRPCRSGGSGLSPATAHGATTGRNLLAGGRTC